MARAEKIVSCSEAAVRSRAIMSSAKKSVRKAKVLKMINIRMNGPGLSDLKNQIKTEND